MSTALTAGDIELRHLRDLDDLEACVDLQVEVWGYADGDVIPKRVFLVATKIGGQVIGAYHDYKLAGFAMALPGIRNGHAYLHSHMLAVSEEFRNFGLGRRLKLAQRDDALARGIELIEWTFDPTEMKNAFLNIEKLGAIVRRYTPDFYGASSSPLQGGLPTDRLHAEWWLSSRRVKTLLETGENPKFDVIETVTVTNRMPEWKRSAEDRPLALEVQQRNRRRLQGYFAEGLSVLGFSRDAEGHGTFQLGKWDEPLIY